MDTGNTAYDREALVQQMTSPDFYPHPPGQVTHLQTHISDVFLAGDVVYKIKKPVNLGFLDFTTLEKRAGFCSEEVRLNQRLTSGIYLGVETITRDKDGFRLNGTGRPVEHAVKMRRLPDENTLTSMLRANLVSESFVNRLVQTLVDFYQTSTLKETEMKRFGSFGYIKNKCRENFQQMPDFSDSLPHNRKIQFIQSATRIFLDRHKELFDRRIDHRHICDTHGDLKTEHVYQYQGVQILDCIEFNQKFRYQDTASDLAFLAMDMEFLGHRPAALFLLSRYVDTANDPDLMQVIDFYKCYRAMVQVKVYHLQTQNMPENADDEKARHIHQMEQYLKLGYQYAVKMACPVIWVVCGMIATGKSTVAKKLAAMFSIPLIRSDEVRKRLFDDLLETSEEKEFEQGMYAPEATSLVYGRMLLSAQTALDNGRSVILDATCRKLKERRDLLQLSKDASANIIFIECRCPDQEIKNRLKKRERHPSVSDAGLAHFEDIKNDMDPFDDIPEDMHMPVKTDQPLDRIIETILTGEHELLARQTEKKTTHIHGGSP
jgi:aminoglycoside phosphotransferase family enzyme/predicted kinase